jgi:nucleoid-associated protein YgaU
VLGVTAALALAMLTACGGGAAAPTPTTAAASPAGAAVAPSPPRPGLASPAASPSPAVVSAVTPAASATAEVAGGDSYEIQAGDTLATIAQQFYGDPTEWRRIYDANKDTIGADPDKLKLGTKLTIPPKQS